MKKFEISFNFEGNGTVTVEAKNKEEAEKKFFEGQNDNETWEEWGENYFIHVINEQ